MACLGVVYLVYSALSFRMTNLLSGGEMGNDVGQVTLLSGMMLVHSVFLAWGGANLRAGSDRILGLVSATTSAMSVCAAAFALHPVLLVMAVIPVVAVIGAWSPGTTRYLSATAAARYGHVPGT